MLNVRVCVCVWDEIDENVNIDETFVFPLLMFDENFLMKKTKRFWKEKRSIFFLRLSRWSFQLHCATFIHQTVDLIENSSTIQQKLPQLKRIVRIDLKSSFSVRFSQRIFSSQRRMTPNSDRLFGSELIQRRIHYQNRIHIVFQRICKHFWLVLLTNIFVFSIHEVEANYTPVIMTHVCFPCVFQQWMVLLFHFDNINSVHWFTIREISNESMKHDEPICYDTAKRPFSIFFVLNFHWQNTMEIRFISMFFRPLWVEPNRFFFRFVSKKKKTVSF